MPRGSIDLDNPMFLYLDGLKNSGLVDMFNSTPYLMRAFKLKEKEANVVLSKWMFTYKERQDKFKNG